jgi:hypothetical protein
MPSQKSQHYVPQFLLRRFSQDGASIGLHNLKSGRQIEGASLKHQACRDWFYGRDGHIEKVLSQFEGDASTVLRTIEEALRPPRRYGVDHHSLATFLHIQAQRTAQAVSEANEMLNKMGKSMLRRRLTDPKLLDALDDVEMSLTDPTDMTLRRAILDTPVILDLKFKLLHNVSGSPFILGDHPVIIVCWNSTYMADAIAHLRASGDPAPDDLLVHTSPVGWEHIAFSGDFLWDRAAAIPVGRRQLNVGRRVRGAA